LSWTTQIITLILFGDDIKEQNQHSRPCTSSIAHSHLLVCICTLCSWWCRQRLKTDMTERRPSAIHHSYYYILRMDKIRRHNRRMIKTDLTDTPSIVTKVVWFWFLQKLNNQSLRMFECFGTTFHFSVDVN
jgi:hypothetical protein